MQSDRKMSYALTCKALTSKSAHAPLLPGRETAATQWFYEVTARGLVRPVKNNPVYPVYSILYIDLKSGEIRAPKISENVNNLTVRKG